MADDTIQVVETAELADKLGKAIADGIASQTRRKVPYGEYIRRPNLYHPRGAQFVPKPTRLYYVNGDLLNGKLHQVHDEEISLLNKITHSGRYIERLVEVFINNDSSEPEVHVRFSQKTVEQRMELKGQAKDLRAILRLVVEAQTAENEAKAEKAEKIEKQSFSSKSTQEARAAAAAKA